MTTDKKKVKNILVTGANGMLGKAVCEKFKLEVAKIIPITRAEVDLRNLQATLSYFSKYEIDLVVHCAALVGGIQANIAGGSKFFLENVQIDYSVINAAKYLNIKNFIYIGSSCMYPANLKHPIKEIEVLSGPLEPSNENYALAKIFGSRMVVEIAKETNLNWRVFVASNLYGPNDHFDDSKSHLLSAVISKAIFVKENKLPKIEMWGDGTPKREFTYIDDFADWIHRSSNTLEKLPYFLNIGYGEDYTVIEIYEKVLAALSLETIVTPNTKMPNGNSRKLMDSSVARSFGWDPKVNLDKGIRNTIEWYRSHKGS
jgi:GDP-L-fucose synthase